MRFVRFLENAGRIDTTGELEDNLHLLEAFLTGLYDDGYTPSSIKSFRYACTGFIVWLHLARIRLCDVASDVFEQYLNRDFICTIPGLYSSRRKQGTKTRDRVLRNFFSYLVSIGRIAPLEPVPIEPAMPARLERFALLLECTRCIAPEGIRQHVRAILSVLHTLGDNPDIYDAFLIRQVVFEAMQPWSHSTAQHLASSMRMYLRAGVGGFGRWWSAVSGTGLIQDAQGPICVTSGWKVNNLVGGMISYIGNLYLSL